MAKPLVAVVGRPNVGKSTFFNKIAGRRISIVEDTPGVTRDRIYADCEWLNHKFTLIDTGGIEPRTDDILLKQMRRQAEIAIDTCDVILFFTDGRTGMTADDEDVATMLRKSRKPVILVVNKVDYQAIPSPSPRPTCSVWAICWMKWSSISRRMSRPRTKRSTPFKSPSSAARTWANPAS